MEEVFEHYLEVIKEGGEGTIVKTEDSLWKDGTSNKQLKVKMEFDVEVIVKGFNPGTPGNAFEDTLGSLYCESSDALLSVNVSGMTEKLRYEIWDNQDKYINRVITVRAHRVIKDKNKTIYSLYLPRLIEFRDDKTEADSLEKILATEAAIKFVEKSTENSTK